MKISKCAGCRKEKCDGCSLHPGWQILSIKTEKLFLPDSKKEVQSGLGIAFDIGTTTVAGTLWDLEKGNMLLAKTCVNPQRIVGSDVVSRISYCMQKEENAKELQKRLIEALDKMAESMLENWKEQTNNAAELVKEVVMVGNTAMCEIVGEISTEGLWKAPFSKNYEGCLTKTGKELGFAFLEKTQITILPCIDGYVGADALAVYTYVKQMDGRKNVLAIDIGTNGEIILIGEEKVYACSAAAGPALEGAAVVQGMGAMPGAIEEVMMGGRFPREDIYCKVIGDCSPQGICGSGLVDALAFLKKYRVIDENGYMLSREEARKAGVSERICQRIIEKEGKRKFLLTEEIHPVYITTEDIRQLQLAKSAIRAAVQILLKKAGLQIEDVTHLYLAGAFGSYIKIENALAIGLLPEMSPDKISHIGNSAMIGAAMALYAEDVKKDMEHFAREICHVELAKESCFEEYFLKYMAILHF